MKFIILLSALIFGSLASAQESDQLMGRKHNLALQVQRSSAEVEDTVATKTEILSAYRLNFGRFEAGVSFGNLIETVEDGDEEYTTSLGAIGRINAVENVPGNNLIPYGQVGFGRITANAIAGGGDPVIKMSGMMTSFGAGVMWYPFGEILAIDLSAGRSSGGVDIDVTSGGNTTSLDADTSVTAFSAVFTVSFDDLSGAFNP